MILLHHIQRVQVRNGLEGVEGDQRAASMCVEDLCAVPGLQTFQHCQTQDNTAVIQHGLTIGHLGLVWTLVSATE